MILDEYETELISIIRNASDPSAALLSAFEIIARELELLREQQTDAQ